MGHKHTKQVKSVDAAKSRPGPHCATSAKACSLSSPTGLSSLGDPQHGGALFILPRELRDEIYRSVVYIIPIRQGKICTAWITANESKFGMRKGLEFALFRVSKAISHEASEMWSSESSFSFKVKTVDQGNQNICLPAKVTGRLKRVRFHFPPEVYIGCSKPERLDTERITAVFKAAIAPFTGSHILRNSLAVDFGWNGKEPTSALGPIFETFKELTGFATVSFEVYYCPLVERKEQDLTRVFHLIGRQLGKMLEPTLGPPATKYHKGLGRTPTFHPRMYLTDSTGKDGASV